MVSLEQLLREHLKKYIVKKFEELKSYTRKCSFSAKENSKEIKEDMKHKTNVK